MSKNPDQYILPFRAATNELLAQLELLRDVETELPPGRQDKVIELLIRLALLGNDLTESHGIVSVRAHMTRIAAGVKNRTTYSDRAIRQWRTWATELGVLSVEYRSHRYGRREWNLFRIHVNRIREIIAGHAAKTAGKIPPDEGGSGRKWAEGTSGPRAEGTSGPGAEVTSAPYRGFITCLNKQQPTNHANVSTAEELPAVLRELVVVVSLLGIAKAEEAIRRAVGHLTEAEMRTRITHFSSMPQSEQRPGVLYNWLVLPRSFDRELLVEAATLELAKGLDGPSELRRAELIRHGRQRGWEHARLQHAIKNFEAECLNTNTTH